MTRKLKPYPKYQDSGTPWFGNIPVHWAPQRLGALLEERGEVNQDGRIHQVLSVLRDVGVIPYEEKGNIGNKRSEDISRYKIVRRDDIVVNCMNVIIGSVGLSKYTGCLSPVYYVLKTRHNVDLPEYFDYVFKVKPFQRSMVRLGKGILAHRMRISMESLKCEIVPRPPRDEQRAIVRFLDHHDRLTRCYIRAQRRLIALLEEQKQALIQRAVTRGRNPNVQLKPSGVEQLGEIPAHWEVRRLKRVCRFGYGDSLPTNDRVDGNIPVYGSNGQVGAHNESNTQGPCVIVGRKGSFGKVNYSSSPVFAIDTTFFVDELLTDAHLRWLFYVLTWADLDATTEDSAIPGLDRSEAYSRLVPFCPLSEQQQIAEWLDQRLIDVDAVIDRTQSQIDLVREYRTRLIADVVTGKLDVRGVTLPEVGGADGAEDLVDVDAAYDDLVDAVDEEDPDV